MNINKLDHIALVKLYSTDDTDSYESKAVVAGMDETQNYILVFPAFAQYPMTFNYHTVHDRFAGQAQRVMSVHAAVNNLFNLGRYLVFANHYRELRQGAYAS